MSLFEAYYRQRMAEAGRKGGFARAKNLTLEQRSGIGRQSAAKIAARGQRGWTPGPKPKCLCGECRTCKNREFQRQWRARRRTAGEIKDLT